MKPTKNTEKFITNAAIHSDPEANRAVLEDLLKHLALARRGVPALVKLPYRKHVVKGRTMKAVVAAAAITILVLIIVSLSPQHATRERPEGGVQSAADMLTVGYLNAACRRGGLNEVEMRCEQAAERLGLQPKKVSMEELLDESKGT